LQKETFGGLLIHKREGKKKSKGRGVDLCFQVLRREKMKKQQFTVRKKKNKRGAISRKVKNTRREQATKNERRGRKRNFSALRNIGKRT